MKSPLWVKIVGIVTIIMGCVGLLGSFQMFFMPQMVAAQKRLLPELKKKFQELPAKAQKHSGRQMDALYEKLNTLPDWFDVWCAAMGIGAVLFSICYIIAAIGLLRLKGEAIGMFYWVVGLDVIFLIFRAFMGTFLISWLGVMLVVGAALGVTTSLILLLTVMTGDKKEFTGIEAL